MKIINKPQTPSERFELFLHSIGGLKNGYKDTEIPITTNICSCGDGWLPIIQECIEKLIKVGWDRKIYQIKEKFGGLRFYACNLPELGDEIIREAESKCDITCELCGNDGGLRSYKTSWIRVLCDKCNEK